MGPELRRIIEFLNGQMANNEVLAIEVKQYVDDADRHQTIVPHLIGNTENAKRAKHSRPQTATMDRASLLAARCEIDVGAAEAARGFLEVGYPLPSTWGRSVAACRPTRRSPGSTTRAASTS